MKKLLYSLMTLAAALTVTSCLKEVEGGSAAYDDGTLVDATFSVTLGPQTKAFATGSTANQLYAGLYEQGETAYVHVADTKVAVSDMKGTITFEKGLQRGKSYKVVFWAQHEADGFTSPYTVNLNTAAPSVTVAISGAANDDNRDAFYEVIEFGPVTGDVAYAEGDIILKRPFAQVNVIVPNENVDVTPAQDQKSSMTVTGAPNELDLLTGTASGAVAYSFTEAAITETAVFGTYTEHQYLAMNYVLVDQTGAGSYPVTFSVTSDAQVASNKTVNVPLKPNVRTNIVGNVFQDNFNFSGVAVVTPGTEEGDETLEIRTVTIKVDGSEPGDSEHVAVGGTSVLTLTFDGELNGSIEAISSNPNVATVEVTGVKEITVTGVSAGSVTITITIPGGTKADYGERIIVIPYEVGDVQNKVAAPTFSPAAGAVAVGTEVTLTTTTADATIQYKLGDGEYQNYTAAIAINEAVTITAKATKEGMTDSEEAVAAYTIAAPQPTKLGTPVLDEENAVAEESSITLVWDDIENATSYAVTYKVKDAAGEAAVVSPAPTTGGVSIENLDAETTYTITVQAMADGFEASDVASIDLTTLATTPVVTSNIANVREQITSTNQNSPSEFSANLAGAVVTYVNGKYNYLEDASGAIVLFMENAGLTAGQTISGVISGTGYIYNGTPQITSIGTEYTAAEGGTIPETTVTIADLLANYDTYLSRRIKLVGVTVTGGISGSDRDGTIEQSGASIAVRSQINNGPTLTENEIGDLITFPALYNPTKQVSLYETSQFTKTGVVPVLSAPTSATVNADVTSYTWNISSNTGWTITPGTDVTASTTSGNGDAGVTLTFAENTTDQSREFAATVSATDCEPVTITITQNGTGTVVTSKTYTITWNSTNNSKSVSSYADEWSVTADGLTCEMTNWNNNNNGWGYVKAGRKNSTSVATIITSAAIPESIKTVTLTIDALTANNINSIKLYVSDSSTFGNTEVGSFDKSTGDQSITISSPGANKFYKIEVDCASGSSNGLITVSKLVFTTE